MAPAAKGGGKAGAGHADDGRDPFAAFVTDDDLRAVLTTVAELRQWDPHDIRGGGLSAAIRTSVAAAPARTLIVDIAGLSVDDAVEGLAELVRGGSTVLAVGPENDVHLFRRLAAAGVRDYLVKPVTVDQVDEALRTAERPDPTTALPSRLVAFVGARGGVGATTIATNVAWLIAESQGRRTALIDLDPVFGTVALSLDIDPTPALREIFDDPDRLDDVFLKGAMVHLGKSLSVLAGEDPLGTTLGKPGAAALILTGLRDYFDVVVADMPRSLVGESPTVLDDATVICIVLEPTLPGVRDTNRLVTSLSLRNPTADIKILVNRVTRKPELSEREVGQGIGRNVDLWLEESADIMAKSDIAGRPVADLKPRHPWIKQLSKLAVTLAGVPVKQKRPMWKRLLRA
jgi:pilus assembly protein CpaE